MENDFIPYEQALALKELGFKELCCRFFYVGKNPYVNDTEFSKPYNYQTLENTVSRPLYQQAFNWCRENHEIEIHIYKYRSGTYDFDTYCDWLEEGDYGTEPFDTYEEAQLACLKTLIENIKNKDENNN